MTDDAGRDLSIQPVAFTPSDGQGPGRRWRPWMLVLAVLALLTVVALWFLFTARSVRFTTPEPADAFSIDGGLRLQLGDVVLLRPGTYQVSARVPGYEPYSDAVTVSTARNQTIPLALLPLPGRISVRSVPSDAEVWVDGSLAGRTPLADLPLPAGERQLLLRKPRYQDQSAILDVTGRDVAQTLALELAPDWADIEFGTEPAGAEIFIDDEPTGQLTPATVPVLAGEREIRLKAPGHKSFRRRLLVTAGEPIQLTGIELEQADGLLTVSSRPAGAGITLDGQFVGEAPVELAVRSGTGYRIGAFKSGFAPARERVRLAAGEERDLLLNLTLLTGSIDIQSQPADAELFVNGELRGPASGRITLPARAHNIEIRAPGHAGYKTVMTPKAGVDQELKVRLLTLEEARLAALQPEVTAPDGQRLKLIKGGRITLGASRREPGRRANETLLEVNLERLFYIGTHEVTNAAFRVFSNGHDSGAFQEEDLNKDELPAVDVSWLDAVAYCNWLSDQEGLTPFYRMEAGQVVGITPAATGYRLPTEAEWSLAARHLDTEGQATRFPWGENLPPPDRHGNYADRSAAHLVGRIIFNYNDNYIAAAPVGTFPANAAGLYDMGGNVAEWIHDFYDIPSPDAPMATDPLGPASGEYHVIKGASWMHGTITDLRLSYRDYGIDGRQDVGFRVARYAEAL